jgi:2-dehydro-3-deoxyglucarate aldolase
VKNLRRELRGGRPVIGSWLSTCSPVVAELMAAAGFDFLAVDAEHSAADLGRSHELFQAVTAGSPDCAPLVRLPGCDYETAKHFLDVGAAGLIGPLVNEPEQAECLVRAARYPPEGRRGVGFCRANMYGMRFDETMRSANEETLVAVQIEHADGVERIDEILSVPGVDAVFVGPYDLSASLGVTAQFDHPDMVAATRRVLEAAGRHGVAPGIHVVEPEPDEVLRRVAEGYLLIAYSLDVTMLAHECRTGLSAIRQGAAGRSADDTPADNGGAS